LTRRLDPAFFPIRALQAVCLQPPGKVFNTFRHGGAISALCGPGYKVFIDSREDLFPPAIHSDYRRIALVEDGWREALRRYDPDYLFWSRELYGWRLLERLDLKHDWRVIVDEPVGGLWVRVRDPETAISHPHARQQ
jgi:hypothetical protein